MASAAWGRRIAAGCIDKPPSAGTRHTWHTWHARRAGRSYGNPAAPLNATHRIGRRVQPTGALPSRPRRPSSMGLLPRQGDLPGEDRPQDRPNVDNRACGCAPLCWGGTGAVCTTPELGITPPSLVMLPPSKRPSTTRRPRRPNSMVQTSTSSVKFVWLRHCPLAHQDSIPRQTRIYRAMPSSFLLRCVKYPG